MTFTATDERTGRMPSLTRTRSRLGAGGRRLSEVVRKLETTAPGMKGRAPTTADRR